MLEMSPEFASLRTLSKRFPADREMSNQGRYCRDGVEVGGLACWWARVLRASRTAGGHHLEVSCRGAVTRLVAVAIRMEGLFRRPRPAQSVPVRAIFLTLLVESPPRYAGKLPLRCSGLH